MPRKLLFLLCGLLFLTACGDKHVVTAEPAPEEPKLYCPIDGLQVEELSDTPPFVVSLDNAPSARPQWGLSQADLVYEVPAEGGISRYLAVFYHGKPAKIGPVRSARPYMVDIARQWQGVFVHCGGSQDALKYLKSGGCRYLNELAGAGGFYRDKSLRAPHNLFTSYDNLAAEAAARSWQLAAPLSACWDFITDDNVLSADAAPQTAQAQDTAAQAEQAPTEAATTVKVRYLEAGNTYQYDGQSGLYLRFVAGEPQIDPESCQQIAVANIIIQQVTSRVLDSEGRLDIKMTGEGKACVITGGLAQKGSWRRAGLDDVTAYLDEAGQPIALRQGLTFIQVVDGNCSYSWQ